VNIRDLPEVTDFFMLFNQSLETFQKFTPETFPLSDLLSPEIIDECLADTGVVTLRKRRLSMGLRHILNIYRIM